MGFTEFALLIVLVLAIPLAIAGTVTLWSLKQVQYRPKHRRPAPAPVVEDAADSAQASGTSSDVTAS